MKVFISSVRRDLAEERDYLPELLTAIGHTPSRFEDFAAQDLTSRGACLTGVQEADVYLLLLGATYGDEMSDSGFSATEEEFNAAKERGLPTYVFTKRNVIPEAAQQKFMDTVGRYHNGRFWKSFTTTADLGLAVASALRDHEPTAPDFEQMPLSQPVTVTWRQERPALAAPRDSVAVLEALVLPVETTRLRPVASLDALANQLAADARQQGFFGHGDALTIESDSDGAWAVRDQTNHNSGNGWNERTIDTFAGVHLSRDGTITIFQALPRDMLGSVVDQADLNRRLTVLLRHVIAYLPDSGHVALGAAIDPAGQVSIGDPESMGSRNQGRGFGLGREDRVRAAPTEQVATESLGSHLAEAAGELAVRLMIDLRRR